MLMRRDREQELNDQEDEEGKRGSEKKSIFKAIAASVAVGLATLSTIANVDTAISGNKVKRHEGGMRRGDRYKR